MVTILIAGGGTGGHVFPMIAVGDALRAGAADVRVIYVGTARGIEARVMKERGDELELMDIRPLRGGGLRGFLTGVTRAAASIPEARRLVARTGATAVLSVGGYAGGPVTLAARTLGVPVALLEPNSVLGLSNRLLAPLVDRAYTAFPEVERSLRAKTVVRAGVPLRGAFAPAPYAPREGRVSVLVLGGSLGAKALNEIVPEAIRQVSARASAAGISLDVVHQTGRDREDTVRAFYASLGLSERALVVPFINNVASALTDADVVIARAGASSCAELCVVGRAGILIPYPFAADDHQLKNARSLESAGAASAIPQSEASIERVAGELARLCLDADLRTRMARASASIGNPDAARRVAEDLLALARSRGPSSGHARYQEAS